ncbi:hypothetical protein AAY473_016015, partial [Plecturocebus cupreus]
MEAEAAAAFTPAGGPGTGRAIRLVTRWGLDSGTQAHASQHDPAPRSLSSSSRISIVGSTVSPQYYGVLIKRANLDTETDTYRGKTMLEMWVGVRWPRHRRCHDVRVASEEGIRALALFLTGLSAHMDGNHTDGGIEIQTNIWQPGLRKGSRHLLRGENQDLAFSSHCHSTSPSEVHMDMTGQWLGSLPDSMVLSSAGYLNTVCFSHPGPLGRDDPGPWDAPVWTLPPPSAFFLATLTHLRCSSMCHFLQEVFPDHQPRDRVFFCHPGWSTVVRFQLTAASASWVQQLLGPTTNPFLTILFGPGEDLLTPDPVSCAGEGQHLDAVVGVLFQPIQLQGRLCGGDVFNLTQLWRTRIRKQNSTTEPISARFSAPSPLTVPVPCHHPSSYQLDAGTPQRDCAQSSLELMMSSGPSEGIINTKLLPNTRQNTGLENEAIRSKLSGINPRPAPGLPLSLQQDQCGMDTALKKNGKYSIGWLSLSFTCQRAPVPSGSCKKR